MRQNWNNALQTLISEAYDLDVRDQDDTAAMVVLIALHDAIKGESDLHELAEMCVNHSRGIKMKPVVERVQTKLWIPPQDRII